MQASSPSERELVDRLERQRGSLLLAADRLREPAHRVNQADRLIRRGLPLLPYALAAIAAIGLAGSLLRGRKLKPALVIATGLDLWRLWKSYQATQATALAQQRARALSTFQHFGE
jgi:hypothetical protein